MRPDPAPPVITGGISGNWSVAPVRTEPAPPPGPAFMSARMSLKRRRLAPAALLK